MNDKNIYLLTAALCLLAIFSLACGNECGFHEQCNGQVREICGAGPDQMFGRDINEVKCEGENPMCAELDDRHTECVTEQPCDLDSFAQRCEGDKALRCAAAATYYASENPSAESKRGYVQINDCATSSSEETQYGCMMDEGVARCVPVASAAQ